MHNPRSYPIETELLAAGWHGGRCGDADPDDPDWVAEPEYEPVVDGGETWSPPEPWRIPLDRFDECEYESARLRVADLRRADA